MASPIIQVKRGNLSQLPALKAGEPAFTTDSHDFYVGKDNNAANNQFVGSGRYWTVNTATTASGVNLVEGTSNGTSFLTIKAPDSLAGIQTYTFPATPTDTFFLKTNSSGVLSWSNEFPEVNFSGIVTFTDTNNNTLGDEDTGSVQLDGGIGIAKNATVKQNLHVGGYSEFVGLTTITNTTENTIGTTDSGALQVDGGMGVDGNVTVGGGLSVTGNSYFVGMVTFASGSNGNITIGDANTDNLVINADVNSHIIPNTDDTYDLGSSSQEWRNLYIDGTANIDTLAVDTVAVADLTDNRVVIAGSSGELEDDANLTFDGSTLAVGVDLDVDGQTDLDDVGIVGVATITGAAIIDNIQIGQSGTNEIDTSSGDLTIDSAGGTVLVDDELVVTNDIRVNGNDIKASDGNTNITLTSNTLTTVAGDLQVGGNDIKASDGTTAITIDTSGGATIAQNMTVTGDLFVNGSTTQVNTASMLVEDRTIELGLVDGSAPSSATTWDLGVLFNYNSSGAKKAAVAWEHGDGRFKFASVVTDGGGTDNDSPQLTFTTMASIEILSLFIKDTAGTHEVIKYDTGTSQRVLLDITVDGGSF
tara:strand:+ start:2015 stop:3778 length:1764 start_codon:yes stop_codon:yes gene_type:complete